MARSIAAPASRRLNRKRAYLAFGLPRPLEATVRTARTGMAAVWARRRLRIALLTVLIAVPLLGGVYQLLRHSSLSAVEHVQVRGLVAVHGADTAAIETALTSAAHGMSTLAVSPAALRATVAPYPIVRTVRVHPSFPHGLRIEVVERPPVAALVVGGVRTAVAADGVVLGAGYLSGSLPLVNAGKATTATNAATMTLPAVGGSVRGASLLGALAVLGAAPTQLAHAVTRVYSGPKGLTVALHGGVLAYFGDATRPHAKWLSLARVLADPSSAGAVYIDVRLPERPAAGFAPGTTRPDASSVELESSGASDPNTAAELASGLDAAVGGGTGTSAGSGTGTEPSAGAETTRSGSTSAEAGSSGSASNESTSASRPAGVGSGETSETPTTSGVPGG
ncbi:MAG TPA: FtsQ-type POTRA domain-containing protein [Solirubrobacteraceae bacterium]|jgi:cell division protein FtsQ|nr:FtsQ-type POTRA domain-containing protein [Solirubrobacteraceae bacterium]